jgi:hydrogenase maturation protein HypF
MNTYHIHIGGLVQGVGFRPFVCRLAERMDLYGWVSNGNDGVHIEINATEETADSFYTSLLCCQPDNAIIRSHHLEKIHAQTFTDFRIKESDATAHPDLLLTPDMAICSNCRKEITDPENKRYQYPFTTCLECGPRYSIITGLPYDRPATTMAEMDMCPSCKKEYNDIHDPRHYSQTNSCPDCAIPMHLFDNNGVEISKDPDSILQIALESLKHGHIIAVKGIGGYLLLCDATKHYSVRTLRDRKHRPARPFAVMYPSVEKAAEDLHITEKEKQALLSKQAPIVLCELKNEPVSGLSTEAVAPGLGKIGALLPYTPLLCLIMEGWNKPLVATSGNLSGTPIIYTDEDALLWLTDYADFIISFEREIVAPQDDSVLQFTSHSMHPIILRRSRGLAPNYFPATFLTSQPVLAMGAELKSAFAISTGRNQYVSQYLGDQANYESQVSFDYTLSHLQQLLQFKPERILIDRHPNYFVSQKGKELAEEWNIPVMAVQHHKAHFAAVLAENELLNSDEKILGVIWDGTGYGDDEHIWGGEFFLLEDGEMDRYMYLEYFPQLLGDKMSKEPRVSAVSLLRNSMDQLMEIKDLFSTAEREFYLKLLQQKQELLTSSMGRLLDGIAAILKIQSINTYEGEAAMKLEALARSCKTESMDYYPVAFNKNRVDWSALVHELLIEVKEKEDIPVIARKVFVSLAMLIKNVAARAGVKRIAFSGGVFQNAFLVDLITTLLQNEYELYFHRQLSPNDECIGFGQLAYAALMEENKEVFSKTNLLLNH